MAYFVPSNRQFMPLDNLDAKDQRIVALLRGDSRMTTQSIADELKMPRVTVHDRIRRLQERGIIRRFTVQLDGGAIGWPLNGFILANWQGERGLTDRREIAEEICALPFVKSCHIVTGQWDFIIQVIAHDMEDLGDAILDRLSSIEGMGHTRTMVSFYDFAGPAENIA